MNLTLPDNKIVPFVSPTSGLDVKGNKTTITGTVAVTVSDPAILAITTPDPQTPNDPSSGIVSSVGPLGTAQVVFTDTTDAAAPLVVLVDITVIASAAVSLSDPTFGPLRDA